MPCSSMMALRKGPLSVTKLPLPGVVLDRLDFPQLPRNSHREGGRQLAGVPRLFSYLQ